MQRQALQIKSTATALGEDNDIIGNMLWARRGNEFVTVKSLNEQGQPVGVEIFHYRDDLSLESYIYARSATIEDDKTWILHGVNYKKWLNGKETLETLDNLKQMPEHRPVYCVYYRGTTHNQITLNSKSRRQPGRSR